MTAESSVSEQLRALTQLQDLSLKLSGTLALADTLDAIIEAAMAICRADRAAVSYFDDSGALRILRHKGLSDEYVQQRALTRLDPVISEMMTRKMPSIIENVDDLAGISPNYAAWKNEGIASIVTLPLMSEGEVFGVIGAGSNSIRRYTKVETDSMAILATQAGAAISSARLFEQLREANNAKDEFLSTLSHELRTPLTPILGWTHLLRPLIGLDPLLGQGLETIDRNARQLSNLIEDLLDLTRVISKKIELERGPTDLVALLETVIGLECGSRFTVRLPIASEAPQERAKALASPGDKAESESLGLRVLVIEDSLDTSNMLKLWLSTFGCDVLVAGEAGEGIRLAIDAHPDLIISDIGMPDMDGYELMRTLRRFPSLIDVPSIALTGYAGEEDRDLALAAGYSAHLSKPAEMGRLLHLIKKLTTAA